MRKNILIVDDSVNMRKMLREILEYYGYNVTGEEESGSNVLEKYVSLKPDLVLLDINIPGMSGIDVMGSILKTDPRANIIIVSFINTKEIVRSSLQAGAKDFIIKPFPIERLIKTIERVLAKSPGAGH